MLEQFQFNVHKCFEVLFFIIQSFGGSVSVKRLFQIVYLVERQHLAKYGLPVTGDVFLAGRKAPLPFNLLCIYMGMNGRGLHRHFAVPFGKMFAFSDDGMITARQSYDDECISESEVESLFHVIHLHKKLDDASLAERTCDQSWMSAEGLGFLSLLSMAEEGGAGPAMLEYLQANLNDEVLFSDESTPSPMQLIELFDIHMGDILERTITIGEKAHRCLFVVLSASAESYRLVRIRPMEAYLRELNDRGHFSRTFEKVSFPNTASGAKEEYIIDCSRVESVQPNRIISFQKSSTFPVERLDASLLRKIREIIIQSPTVTQRTRKLL